MMSIDKVKLVLLLLGGLVILASLYFVFFRPRRIPFVKSRQFQFDFPKEQVKKMMLDNGMTVLLLKTSATPTVLVQIAYDIGSAVETSVERGLAHLIEHMIFKGTQKMAEGDIDGIARKYGATFNAFTSMDVTSYYFETDKNNWKPFVEILADCMQNARFDEQHLASELKAVIQELRMYKDHYWKAMYERAMRIVFPSNHPYHFPIIGFKQELLNLSADDLKAFYKKYYHPSHATLFIVGDINDQEAFDLAKEHFASIPNNNGHLQASFPDLIPDPVSNHTCMYEDVKKEQLGFYWVMPGLKAGKQEVAALVEHVLGYGDSGRLVKKLVDEKKIATSVAASATSFMEAGLFFIFIEPVEGKRAECEEVVRTALQELIEKGVSESELAAAIKTKGRGFLERLQSHQSFVYSWLQSYFATRDEYDIFNRINRFQAINSEQIVSFIKMYLDPLFMNSIALLPLPQNQIEKFTAARALSDELDKKILAKHERTTPLEAPKLVHSLSEPEKLSFSFPKPQREITLPNGLKVLLCKHGHLPLVSAHLAYRDDDYLGSSLEGVKVNMMMTMLIEGSKHYTKQDNVAFFNEHGAAYGFDTSGIRLSLLNEGYEEVFNRLVWIASYPTFPHDALDKIKTIFVDSYERSKDQPASVMERSIKNVLYQGKDFGWTFDEAIQLINGLNRVDLCKLHMQFLCAHNMVLSVAGNFNLDDMQAIIEKTFSRLPAGSMTEFKYPAPQFTPKKQVDEYMMRDQALLALFQPSSLNIYHEDLIPVRLLNVIAFNSLGSRLYALREKTGLFYSGFGAFAAAASREPGFDYVGAIVSLDKIDQAERMIRQMLHDFSEKGVLEKELKDARQIYLKGIIDKASTIGSIAGTIAKLDALKLDDDYYDKVLARIQEIDCVTLNKKAALYFKEENMARVRIGRIGK